MLFLVWKEADHGSISCLQGEQAWAETAQPVWQALLLTRLGLQDVCVL